jgi:hypothetical protein
VRLPRRPNLEHKHFRQGLEYLLNPSADEGWRNLLHNRGNFRRFEHHSLSVAAGGFP